MTLLERRLIEKCPRISKGLYTAICFRGNEQLPLRGACLFTWSRQYLQMCKILNVRSKLTLSAQIICKGEFQILHGNASLV